MLKINHDLLEKLFFAALILGIGLIVIGAWQIIDTTSRLNQNEAAQFRATGEPLDVQTTTEARGLVAADLEMRDLVKSRFEGMTIGGVGLIALAIGWIGTDIVRGSRRKREAVQQQSASSPV